MILFINNEHCTSVEQLKGYFTEDLTLGSDIYADLLDYGRSGDIAGWLREMNEPELATKVESIPNNFGDHAFFAQLKAAVLGTEVTNIESLKPSFEKCFSIDGVKCDIKDSEAKVSVGLNVLMSVNEEYELTVTSDWGTRVVVVNPYNYTEGNTAAIEFILRKRSGMKIGGIKVYGNGKELTNMTIHTGESNGMTSGEEIYISMIRVEGGTITMGNGYRNQHQESSLATYYIGETQVTQALWKSVMGMNPSYFKGDELPVESVSWNDCQEFIRRLNLKTGKKYRLPSEAEWEFAARGGKKSNSDIYSGGITIGKVAWYDGNSDGKTHPVKQKQANELGIYDMSGNVSEWCQDWYGDYSNNIQINPTGPNRGTYRVNRGGSWCSVEAGCRSDFRGFNSPTYCNNSIGLRLAYDG